MDGRQVPVEFDGMDAPDEEWCAESEELDQLRVSVTARNQAADPVCQDVRRERSDALDYIRLAGIDTSDSEEECSYEDGGLYARQVPVDLDGTDARDEEERSDESEELDQPPASLKAEDPSGVRVQAARRRQDPGRSCGGH